MQGQVQLRLIKDLLATDYNYMQIEIFADAYKKAIQERNSAYVPAGYGADENRDAWAACIHIIGELASIRFTQKVWFNYFAEPITYPNLTIAKE